VKKSPKNAAQPIFVKFNTQLEPWNIRSQKNGLLMRPKVNNRPMVKDSPNLVTLEGSRIFFNVSQPDYFFAGFGQWPLWVHF
jgi:hypothetical protein